MRSRTLILTVLALLVLLPAAALAWAPGALDTAFTANNGTGSDATIGVGDGVILEAVATQPDGKLLIAGEITKWNGTLVPRGLVRLNRDGTRDTTFPAVAAGVSNGGSGGDVYAIAVQPDGKILIGGHFTTWNSAATGHLVRLNADGTRDTGFALQSFDSDVQSIVVQPDGKILVGGYFTQRLMRLNRDGTTDAGFTFGSATPNPVLALALQPDGKILVGGQGGPAVVRINADGTADATFTAPSLGGGDIVSALAVQADGKILAGGQFAPLTGTATNSLVRLNSNGTIDTAFAENAGTGASTIASSATGQIVWAIAIQPNGKILLVGGFDRWNTTTGVNGIVRLDADGAVDTAFRANTGTGFGATGNPIGRGLAVQSGNAVLVGYFTTWNGTSVGRIVRIGAPYAPGTPTGVSASTPTGTATAVSFTPPADDGGEAPTYTATCTSTTGGAAASATSTSSPITVSGLTAGATYTCTVIAATAYGTSAASSASAAITVPRSTTITRKRGKAITRAALLATAGLKAPKGAKVAYRITGRKGGLKPKGTGLVGAQKGTYRVTITVTPKKGKKTSKAITVVIS